MLLGMILCDLYYNPNKSCLTKQNNVVGIFALLLGFLLLSVPKVYPTAGIYRIFSYIHVTHYLFWAIVWALIIVGVENLPVIRRFLEMKLFQKLGSISFAVFAIHWPIVISFTCYFLMKLVQNRVSYMGAVMAVMVVTLAIVIASAYFVQNMIYKPLYQLEKGIINKLENE